MNQLLEIVKSKTDSELIEMLYEPDQWSTDMLNLVKEQLHVRNIFPSDYEEQISLRIKNEKRNLELGKPASLIGKIVACVTILGLFGIYMGYHYKFSKIKSKYTDEQFYVYDKKTREFGEWVFYLAIIFFAFGILLKITR